MTKSKNVTLPVTALTPDQIAQVESIADQGMISKTAVMRQAIQQFVDQPEDQISAWVNRDYGKCIPFTNVYAPPVVAQALDALAQKFDCARNQIIRAAIARYLESL